jgi:proteic killer suppression protein
MIRSDILRFTFISKSSRQLYEEEKGGKKYPPGVVDAFFDVVNLLGEIKDEKELWKFKSLNFEPLLGKLKEFHSLRLNKQYRLLVKLRIDKDGNKFFEVGEITDYH